MLRYTERRKLREFTSINAQLPTAPAPFLCRIKQTFPRAATCFQLWYRRTRAPHTSSMKATLTAHSPNRRLELRFKLFRHRHFPSRALSTITSFVLNYAHRLLSFNLPSASLSFSRDAAKNLPLKKFRAIPLCEEGSPEKLARSGGIFNVGV